MKNLKRAGALFLVLLLLLLYGATFFFAVSDHPSSGTCFRVSLGCTIFVPVLFYGYTILLRVFQKQSPSLQRSSKIETIIFDVGNVLVNYDWKSYLDSFPYTSQVKEQIGKAVFESETWNEQDRGLLDPGEYIQQFVRNAPQLEEEILQVLSNNEKTISVFDYAKTWTHYLKNQGYRLYILSNYPQRLLEKTQGDMDFLEYMDGVIFSCQVQQVKPEPQIYQTLLEIFSIEPSKAVFLDDRKENLDAAAKFGIHTIQFHNLKQATADLKKLGVE